jgi:heptosyltransferase II
LNTNDLPLEKKRQALVIRLSSLGDVVLSTSVLEPLSQAGFEVSFVTKEAFAPLLDAHPAVREIFSFHKKNGERAGREDFFAWYEARQFDFVLDLQDSWRTRWWRRRLRFRAPVHVARKERVREWLILWARLGRWFSFGRGGRAKKFRRLAVDALAQRKIFAPSTGPLTRLKVTEEERAAARKLVPAGDFAVILPGSAWPGKQWPYFAELSSVISRKIPVVALGAEKDEACDALVKLAPPGSVSLRGKTSLRQSMAVLAEARWIIGNDTGMVHVAEALGKDVAMIEGPTHPYLGFSPHRERSVVLGLDLLCRPCSKSGKFCPRLGTRHCVRGLTVQTVADRLRRWGLPC